MAGGFGTQTLKEAWHTLSPDREGPDGPLAQVLVALTFVTGAVDAFSYLVLGHVFVANMTGNVVFVAFAIAGANGFSLAASLLALGIFVLGAAAGGGLARRFAAHRGRLLAVAVVVESGCVAAAVAVAASSAHAGAGAARYGLVAVLAFAMGTQNASVRRLAVPDLTTTVLTLTITGMAADGRLARGPHSRLGRRGVAVMAMFLGALLGTVLLLHTEPVWCLALALTVLVLMAARMLTSSQTEEAWVRPAGG